MFSLSLSKLDPEAVQSTPSGQRLAMSPPRDPKALSFPKIVFAPASRKGRPHIEEGIICDKTGKNPPSIFW